MTSEPSVDFDWDAIESDTVDSGHIDARADVVRAFLAVAIPPQSIRGNGDSIRLRVMLAVYLGRIPGYERLLSISHICDLCGCDRHWGHRVARSIAKSMGLRLKATSTHRKRIKRKSSA